jgi:hypothetical protein
MQMLLDPVTLVNLILCIVIVIVSITGYVKIRSPPPFCIGAAFFLSGFSHVVSSPSMKSALEQEMIRAPDRNGRKRKAKRRGWRLEVHHGA